jgi:predicted metal-binding protein
MLCYIYEAIINFTRKNYLYQDHTRFISLSFGSKVCGDCRVRPATQTNNRYSCDAELLTALQFAFCEHYVCKTKLRLNHCNWKCSLMKNFHYSHHSTVFGNLTVAELVKTIRIYMETEIYLLFYIWTSIYVALGGPGVACLTVDWGSWAQSRPGGKEMDF